MVPDIASKLRSATFAALALVLAGAAVPGLGAWQEFPSCRISGRATSAGTPLPGVPVVVRAGGAVRGVTSSASDGSWQLTIGPGEFTLRAELTGFVPLEQAVALTTAPCEKTIDIALALAPRSPAAVPASAVTQRPYTRQTFGTTIGGPVRLPGIYDGTRRTNFTFTYGGNRGDDLFNQYATVPDEAMRRGDFSSLTTQLIDPLTGCHSRTTRSRRTVSVPRRLHWCGSFRCRIFPAPLATFST